MSTREPIFPQHPRARSDVWLGSAASAAPSFADSQAAIQWLVETGAIAGGRQYPIEEVRRRAIAKYHPDRRAGDDRLWKHWLQAAAVLRIAVYCVFSMRRCNLHVGLYSSAPFSLILQSLSAPCL